MLTKPLMMFGATKQPLGPGDILDFSENPIYSLVVAGAVSMVAKDLFSAEVIAISGGTAHTVSFPTADQIIRGLTGSMNLVSPPANMLWGGTPNQSVQTEWPANVNPVSPGSSFRRTFRNENSGTTTFAAQATSGVTVSGTMTIATALWVEFLFRILGSSPTVIIPVTTTNTGFTLTNINPDLIANIVPGMSAYGTGIGAAAVVTAVNLDTRTVTVSVASTATADNIPVTFAPTVTVQRLRSGTN